MVSNHAPAEGNDGEGQCGTTHEEFARHWSPARDATDAPGRDVCGGCEAGVPHDCSRGDGS